MSTKKILKIILITFLFFGYNQSTQAQIWKKIKQKAKEKITKTEDKVINKLDKKIDETLKGDNKKTETSKEVPKFSGGSGVLKLFNHGYEYVTNDLIISVYGNFNKENLSSSQKTYNQDKIIIPVDAYPPGYALAYNSGGYLNTKEGQIIIHHADVNKVVFSIKGNWNISGKNQPVSGSFVTLNVTEVVDLRIKEDAPVNYEKEEENERARQKEITDAFKTKTNNTTVTIPSTFSFTSSLEVEMTTAEGTVTGIEFLFGAHSDMYAMSFVSEEMNGGKVYNVVTPKSTTMFMDVSGMKMKKSVPKDQNSQVNIANDVPTNPSDLKKTGATKTILGFTCHEYKYTDKDLTMSIWATKDFPAENASIAMLGMHGNGAFEGFVLEIDTKSGNESSNIKAVKYNKSKNVTIHTAEYKSMGF